MRKLIIVLIILVAILAPLELLGFLRKGVQEIKDIVSSPEALSLVEKFKSELLNLGERVAAFLRQLLPRFNLGVGEVR